jgi:hypothetical protein
MPRAAARRCESQFNSGYLPLHESWRLEFIPAPRNEAEIRPTETERALSRAAELDGAHILAISKQDGAIRREISEAIRPFFRFVWLSPSILSKSHVPEQMASDINKILREEDVWRDSVFPQDVNSALLLPAISFEARHPLSLIWEEACEYGDTIKYAAIAKRLDKFRQTHWNAFAEARGVWTDASQRVFDHRGPRHGDAPPPRAYKYSFSIPSGFHYDVRHLNGRSFNLLDRTGMRHAIAAGGYINVDPHAECRIPRS